MEALKALSVLDGRYVKTTEALKNIFSEYGLIRQRVHVEIEWLKFISNDLKLFNLDETAAAALDGIMDKFSESDALRVKEIERTTNHDVKAVEYFIKEKLEQIDLSSIKHSNIQPNRHSSIPLSHIREWVHFACTSDDINNTAYALMVKEGREVIVDALSQFIEKIEEKAMAYKSVPMMSRTHGQPATPTTTGKEFVNFAWRLNHELNLLQNCNIQAKINGAVGNYNAHVFVFPDIDWIGAGERFLSKNLGLEPLLYTTQINPNAYLSYILHAMVRSAAVTIDFDRDMWGYISLGYFRQHLKKGETGSSTMPHKVNPIDFENSEGNMGLAISMMEHLAVKLQKSRFQRDLSDSTVLRSLGSAFGYYLIGIKSAVKGFGKIAVDTDCLAEDLEANQTLLAEPFQTAMRVYGEENPYERLKEMTRGQTIGKNELEIFVNDLEKVPEQFKSRMRALTPADYTGLAEKLVDTYFDRKK